MSVVVTVLSLMAVAVVSAVGLIGFAALVVGGLRLLRAAHDGQNWVLDHSHVLRHH